MKNSELKDIFDNIIIKEAEDILTKNSGLFLIPNAFELLCSEYEILHKYYSKKYMHPNSKGLDTHKEISTIVIALLKVKILKTVDSTYYETSDHKYAFNERLAFCVGCDILKSAIICDYIENDKLSSEEISYSCNAIQEELLLPKTSYQDYKSNVITEFYYTSREGSYNFLGLADKFFWIEYFNRRITKQKYLKYKSKRQQAS